MVSSRAAPGAWLGVGGPRSSVLMPDAYDAYLLVGDETALPCIARRLEELPPGARAIALIEVADADDVAPALGHTLEAHARHAVSLSISARRRGSCPW